MNQHIPTADSPSCYGYCNRCKSIHQLPHGSSIQYGLKLLRRMENKSSIDLETSRRLRNPQLNTDYLFGEARGKMFGVMECETPRGDRTFLRAFSGQYNGRWLVKGWVGPLFDVAEWCRINEHTEKEIKGLTARIRAATEADSVQEMKRFRKDLSRQLMKDIHSIYRLPNFRGETATLARLFPDNLPTGTGDCCAPKLIGHAARNNLRPISMAEFYVGKENLSGSRRHGRFYPSCREKCQPLLGYMLCGLDRES